MINGKAHVHAFNLALVIARFNALSRSSRVADAPVGAFHYVREIEFPSGVEQLFEHTGVDVVVGLDDADVLPPRDRETGIDAPAIAFVLLVNWHDAAVFFCESIDDFRRSIGCSVVDADDLDVLKRLSANGIEALLQILFDVVYGEDHRYRGIAVHCGLIHALRHTLRVFLGYVGGAGIARCVWAFTL